MTAILASIMLMVAPTERQGCEDLELTGQGWFTIHRVFWTLRNDPQVADEQYEISIVLRLIRQYDQVTQNLASDLEQSASEERRADGTRIREISRTVRETATRQRLFEWTQYSSRRMEEAMEGARQLSIVFGNWSRLCMSE